MITMSTKQPSKLRRYRQELTPSVPRDVFAVKAGISIHTYIRAEQGLGVNYSTALRILHTINDFRTVQQLPELNLEDLELNIT